jgi:hypothetical protein
MISPPSSKRKGDVYIGFLPSESNPPNIMEFLAALHCMAECVLDKVLYAVIDANSDDSYFADTRTHRVTMAKSVALTFSPFVEVFDPYYDGRSMPSEDAAFRLFDLNSDMQFTLFYLSPATETHERTKAIERLVTNIGMRLHGFNPKMHKVVATFCGDTQEQEVELGGTAMRLVEEELFGVHFFKGHGAELPGGKTADEIVLDAISGRSAIGHVLLFPGIAQYISEHEDYRKQLSDYLSAKIDLTSR